MDSMEHDNAAAESQDATNGWDLDDFSLSSDFDTDGIHDGAAEVRTPPLESDHTNCVDKQVYEEEKRSWEDKLMGLSQRCKRKDATIEQLNRCILEKEMLVKKLEAEALDYKETFNRLQEQIVDLNSILYESNEENASLRRDLQHQQGLIDELESKLYGPSNYYYQEYLRSQETLNQIKEEKKESDEQLRQVKDILRNMIIDKSKAPTELDIERERASFAKQVQAYERKISALQDEVEELKAKSLPEGNPTEGEREKVD